MSLPALIESEKVAFAARHNLDPRDPRTLEAFFTHHVLLHRNITEFAAEQSWQGEKMILTGGVNDHQIDAVAIIIDGEVVRSDEDLADFERAASDGNAPLVSFVFVQATGVPVADERVSAKLAGFGMGVFTFLTHDGQDGAGIRPQILEWIKLKNRIFAILDENEIQNGCECALYLVWGRRIAEDNRVVRTGMETAESVLRGNIKLAGRFATIKFTLLDADKLETLIRGPDTVQHNVELSLATFVRLPVTAAGVDTYVGYLRADHLLGLIVTNDTGTPEIRTSFFASNIRSYLGAGVRVNDAIAGTLRDGTERGQFALRSNGIAILAKRQRLLDSGDVQLVDAQIVNGCQTAHTLFHNRDQLVGEAAASVIVPVKIIVTEDKDVSDAAILGLNRQTPVEETQVFTEKDFVDRLAAGFAAPPEGSDRVLFERREGEYKDRKGVKADSVVSLYELARAYAAMFLSNPELIAIQGKKPIIDKIRAGAIFGKNEALKPYHLAGVMVLRARAALETDKFSKDWERYPMKNLLLLAIRATGAQVAGLGNPPGDLRTTEGESYVDQLAAVLLDPVKGPRIAEEAVRVVQRASAGARLKMNAKNAGKRAMADAVVEHARRIKLN